MAVSPPGSAAQAMELIKKYFPESEWDNAFRVMQGESGGNPNAKGDDFPIRGQTIPSYGYFQIRALPGRPSPNQLLNPEFNVQYAANLWKQQGWNPWTVARNLGIANGPPQNVGSFDAPRQQPSQPSQPTTKATSYAPSSPQVPNAPGRGSYTVKPGDTLWGIAEKYLGSGARYGELKGFGGDPRKLPIGTRISY